MFPLNLYAHVRFAMCILAHETAGAARTRSSLRPLIFWAKRCWQNLRERRGEIAELYLLNLAPLAGRGRRASSDARPVRGPLREVGLVEAPPHPLARARDLSPRAGRGKKESAAV